MSEETAPETGLAALAPSFVVTLEENQKRIAELEAFVKQYLKEGEDYGKIPGTNKPTLYKSGAEKLTDVYGFTKEFAILERLEDWERGRFAYTVKAILRSKRNGLVEAEGLGSCNSFEAKYRYNWLTESKLPPGVDKTKLPSQKKKGSRGTYTVYRVINEDPYSQVNTFLKMAKKRALVDAVLSATRSSGLFSQDLEDLRANGVTDTVTEDGIIDVAYTVESDEAPPSRPASPAPAAAAPASRPDQPASGSPQIQPKASWSVTDYQNALKQLGLSDEQIRAYWVEVLGPERSKAGTLNGAEYSRLKKRLADVLTANMPPEGGTGK